MNTAGSGAFDAEKMKRMIIEPSQHSYTDKEIILYHLGIGCSLKDSSCLKYLYEGNEDFSVIPTCSMIFCKIINALSSLGDFNFDLSKFLHGEQYTEVFQPLPTEATVTTIYKIVDVLDKKSGATLIISMETFAENGTKLAYNQLVGFVVGAGGFGGKRASQEQVPCLPPPTRPPDAVIREKTTVDQAALYRLSGDRNPLHIDPDFAALGGFSQPILHGLCSYGHACRHVLKQYANNDVKQFKAMKARFMKPVYPGQTLQTEMWNEGTRIHFQCKVVESNDVVLSGAYIDLHHSEKAQQEALGPTYALHSNALFAELSNRLARQPEIVSKVKGIFLWNITKEKKPVASWTIDLKNGVGAIYRGPPKTEKPASILSSEDDVMVDIVSGNLDPQRAFMLVSAIKATLLRSKVFKK